MSPRRQAVHSQHSRPPTPAPWGTLAHAVLCFVASNGELTACSVHTRRPAGGLGLPTKTSSSEQHQKGSRSLESPLD